MFDSLEVTTPVLLGMHTTFTINTKRECSRVVWTYTNKASNETFNANDEDVVITNVNGTNELTITNVTSAYNLSTISFHCDNHRVDNVTLHILGEQLSVGKNVKVV